jgi:Secretion system C-terminal sorting domain/Fibronectin type III domain
MRNLFLSTLLVAASLSSMTYAQTADCTAPNLAISSATGSSVSVRWNASTDDQGCSLCYKIEWKTKSETDWKKSKSCLTFSNNQTINGLAPATDYDVRIFVKCCNEKVIQGNVICLRTTSDLCKAGAFEPNNKVEDAKTIANNGTVFAAIEKSVDEDWYKFKLVNTKATITLLNAPATVNYQFLLFDAWKRPLLGSPQTTVSSTSGCFANGRFGNDVIWTLTMPEGTVGKDFYIQIKSLANFDNMWCYGLRIKQEGKALLSKDVDNELVANNIEIFPNPVNDQLSINLGNVETASEATIHILDAMGRVVMASQKAVEAGESILNLNVSELNNGLHFAAIRLNDGEVVTRKILVAHEK